MPLVSSVDYPNKRIYLSVDTVNTNLDTLDVYREVRALRRTNDAHRKFKPIIESGGNITKVTGVSYTPAYTVLDTGCYIVPYDQAQRLRVIRDTFTKDGRAGRDCFDRTSVTSNVDIDIDFPEIEIREVTVGGSTLTAADIWGYVNRTLTSGGSGATPADIWSYGSRTLTAIDVNAIATAIETQLANEFSAIPSSAQITAAVVAALQAIKLPVNVKEMNDTPVLGNGTSNNKWRG